MPKTTHPALPPQKSPSRITSLDDFEARDESYFAAGRLLLGWLAIAFPLVLIVFGALLGQDALQHSLSAYYHLKNSDDFYVLQGAMRDVFVGFLWMIGALLIIYKGYSDLEDVLLSCAGCALLVVSLSPMTWPEPDCHKPQPFHFPRTHGDIHNWSAYLFFALIAYVAVCNPDNTLKLLQSPLRKRLYKSAYGLWAALMVFSPPVIIFLGHFISCDYQTLEIEIAMIWPFGGYWLTKSREVADIKAGR